jgi:DNA replication protein DnaC
MTNENKCLMSGICKFAGKDSHCHDLCFPYRKAHGDNGDNGIVALANIPKNYKDCWIENLPIKEDNPDAFEIIQAITKNVGAFVGKGVGLYLYSTPSNSNKRGTGTGKTTSAVTVANHYLRMRLSEHIKKERLIENLPVLFVKVSKFQNTYNAQFRGSNEVQQDASNAYYKLKKQMMDCELLILDDIGLRSSSETMTNELYEIIDHRVSENLAIILTSNINIEELSGVLSHQIASRIEGSCELVDYRGEDKRKGGIF